MPFLTLLDDRAKPKGSRDPLGFELVWTHYGRKVIGNLTTITSSLTNFAVAILGFHWANELYASVPESERQPLVREAFLRYEQLAGYLRFLANHRQIMGINRVSRRLEDKSNKLSFGLAPDEQILSDQTSYGLWGLYSVALRDSGLVVGDNRIPTSSGLALASAIEGKLDKTALIDLMLTDKLVPQEKIRAHATSYMAAIHNKVTQNQLLDILMRGGDHHALQREVWTHTQLLAKQKKLPDHNKVPQFIEALKGLSKTPQLIQYLDEIQAVERLLVAANNIFHYCRRKDGEPIDRVVEAVEGKSYSYAHLSDDLSFSNAPWGEKLKAISRSLRQGDVGSSLENILSLNRDVMTNRDGAPWVEVEANKTLRVRVPSEIAELRSQQALESDWDYEYFMSSYLSIAQSTL